MISVKLGHLFPDALTGPEEAVPLEWLLNITLRALVVASEYQTSLLCIAERFGIRSLNLHWVKCLLVSQSTM